MIQVIDVNEETNIEKFNAAAKEAYEHPETHGLLVKIYADWCGFCRTMTADWNRVIEELKQYQCKKPGCVLTIANIRAVSLEPDDPVIQKIKYIPKDIKSIPSIMYISKGMRGLEYSKNRVYSEMLHWIVSHPDFGLVRKGGPQQPPSPSLRTPLRSITKKARMKFRHFHRGTLKRFHEEMKRQHKKSVKMRNPTPYANNNRNGRRYIPAYLR